MIRCILVANRGEIARRVIATCRTLGVGCVAIYSDADEHAPHVFEADVAVRLPGCSPAHTYLRADLVVAAALRVGADAVHPGYGFLAENADFARAVEDAGLVWIGPPPAAIAAMGRKTAAKRLMVAACVPALPELDPATVTEADLPLLVKADAGGGGRGMRVVRSLADLPVALDAARTEALSAFGDGRVLCEPFLERGRHVEVQVLNDRHGTVWAVGERECSIQRNHQKVVEEAPSPLVEATPGLRDRLLDAARLAARAIDYVGAGTVEFLVDEAGGFFFLEMNTRLQVEHPVTECTTGLDLVRLQIQIADGDRLGKEPPAPTGHAIEARLCAEDPAHDWQPRTGVMHRFEVPGVDRHFGVLDHAGVRLDSGVVAGDVVTAHYDPLLAKLIAWAPTRREATARLAAALAGARIHGVETNRDLLVRVLRHDAFAAADLDTSFLDPPNLAALASPLADADAVSLSALAAALAAAASNREHAAVQSRLPSGWRNVSSEPQRKTFTRGGRVLDVAYRQTRSGPQAQAHPGVRLLHATARHVVLDLDGVRRGFDVARYDGLVCVDSSLGPVTLEPVGRFPDPAAAAAVGSLLAPMPGTVVAIGAAVGDRVEAGRPLLWLEAMKMQHAIRTPATGTVTALSVRVGDQVDAGTVLAVVADATDEEEDR